VSRRVLGIIPARLSSSRLPRKPLHPLLGRPLIAWVWQRVQSFSSLDACVVATDSSEVAEACREIGAPVELTSADHPSGTDRVAEVAGRSAYQGFDVIVNVQGDEPLIDEEHVRAVVALVELGWEVGTCATPIASLSELHDAAVVKVVRAADGAALYFSRAPVPYQREGTPLLSSDRDSLWLRHVGLYAYRKDALVRWVNLRPTRLEHVERLEQLRPLEAGISIGVDVVDAAERGVDTPSDAEAMEARLRELGETLYV
jgi:3-deoxy-manno-octulosonate cytidylyltransferase (CMP-KDO synthetase)